MIDIQPMGDLVMVRVDKSRKERNGLLLAPELSPELEEGTAVAYGQDVPFAMRGEIESCAGGVVYAALDHEANSYEKDGVKFLFIRSRDLMGALFNGQGDRLPRLQAALGKWVLVEWEEAKNTLLGGLLARPTQGAKAHFTGKCVMFGERLKDIERTKRYFFEQFSDFKWWQENEKRYAFIPYSAMYCEIPDRSADVCLAPDEVASEEFAESMR